MTRSGRTSGIPRGGTAFRPRFCPTRHKGGASPPADPSLTGGLSFSTRRLGRLFCSPSLARNLNSPRAQAPSARARWAPAVHRRHLRRSEPVVGRVRIRRGDGSRGWRPADHAALIADVAALFSRRVARPARLSFSVPAAPPQSLFAATPADKSRRADGKGSCHNRFREQSTPKHVETQWYSLRDR